MGLGDFFKNIFGKKTCAFCGGECGMMSRTKIKGDEYICSKCDDMCSNFIRKSRFTKPELEGHMEYMKRLDRIYKEVILPNVQKHECYRLNLERIIEEVSDDIPDFIVSQGIINSKKRIHVHNNSSKNIVANAFFASYGDNNRLEDIEIIEDVNLIDGVTNIINEKTYENFFLWDKNLRPYTKKYSIK